MKTRNIVIATVAALIVISALLVFRTGPIRAEGATDISAVSAKLDEVLNNQKAILSGMESIKAELGVIKIRVTQNQ